VIQIRKALASDKAFLREMLYMSLYVPPGHEPFPRTILEHPDIAKYHEGWGKTGDIGLIAVRDSVDVGAVWLRLLEGEQAGYGYVSNGVPELGIALLAEARGQGIGTALLTELFEEAVPSYEAVSLAVAKGNPAAALYRRAGFKEVREDEDSFVMLKRLSSG
jgi:GNAT superfamily N-acetyltransferase